MTKLTLTDLASTQASSILSTVNANNALIEAALEKTLSRDGTSPNSMEDTLDMNSERIVNLPIPVSPTEPVRKNEFDVYVDAFDEAYTASQQAIQALDDFTDLWLGIFSSDPTVDNDGDPLQEGALYFNSGSNRLKVYAGGVWSTPLSGTVVPSTEIDVTPSGADVSLSLKAGSIDETKLDASTNASLDLADSASQPGHTHVLTDVTNVTITAANLNTLDDGVNTTLHFHASDRSRANHTGTQAASTISDFTEAAQDAVGGSVNTTLTYNDAGNSLGRAAITGHITIPAGSNAAVLGSFTAAQLDAAVSDANVSYTTHTHLLAAGATDVTITAANLNTLDDGVNTTLHFHDSDRNRANHTGTQTSSTVSDFNEAAQDAVGGMVDSTLVYSDATPSLSRAALTGAITASAGSNTTSLGSFTIAQLNTALSDADVQPLDAELTAIAGLTSAAGKGIQFTGSGTAATYDLTAFAKTILDDANAATARTTLGLGTADNPQFATIELGAATDTTISRSSAGVIAVEGVTVPLNSTSAVHTAGTIELGAATDTTLSRASAGDVNIEGNLIYRANGTDVPVTDGGTGSSTASGARTNLGAQAAIQFKDEGVNKGTSGAIDSIDFVGSNIALTVVGTAATVTISGSGTGDVVGPGSATDSNLVAFDGTTGKLIKDGGATSTFLRPATTNTVTVGYTFTPYNGGTVSSGTFTVTPANGNYQYYTNNGAHTLAAPSSDCAVDILITNGASAGSITFSGFTVGSSTGSALTTTNTNKFKISVVRINGTSTYSIYALQ